MRVHPATVRPMSKTITQNILVRHVCTVFGKTHVRAQNLLYSWSLFTENKHRNVSVFRK